MFKKAMQEKTMHANLPHLRRLYLLLLTGSLCVLILSCYHMLSSAQKAQENAIIENALIYSQIMDEQIPSPTSDAALESPSMDSFLQEMEFPITSPTAAFAVLSNGKVIFTKGHNVLSHKLIAAIVEIAKSDLSIYTYTDMNLPDYYFYTITSQVNGLDYCYYEPVLTGWRLFRNSLSVSRGLLLIFLLMGAIFTFSLLVATNPIGQAQERVIEITSPNEEAEETFGSLPYYSGIIIDYFSMSRKSISSETLKLFDQIIRENLSVNKILYQVSAQHNSDCLQYYMNYTNYNLRVLSDSLKMNLYNAAPDYNINIFYSTAVPTCQEMENELLYLHHHLRYSLIMGYGMRISIEQIKIFESSTEVLDPNVASTIQNHLRTRAYDDLYNYLGHFKNVLTHYRRSSSPKYSFKEVYRFAEEAFSVVKLFFQENSFSHPMVQTSCITILRSTPGFGAFCEYLISCIQAYQQENQHVLSSRNEELMNNIYMFIEEDLAGANLNSIARKMQITDSHLSRVFKKITGCNFSEYLSERKLEEAAKLLLQDPKMKVAEISEILGYGNPTYFLSRFKAKFGVSPSAFRKEHLQGNNTP